MLSEHVNAVGKCLQSIQCAAAIPWIGRGMSSLTLELYVEFHHGL